ncbi:putative type I restriction-modification system DNA methylase [Klebsiella grimontii]|nr:putative type I restriction-modification system DNA methylase [Klebsiella grimontii]
MKLPAPVFKVLVNHLAEQDDEAEVCRTKGEPEANADLRDNENVPLGEDIHEYFKREVLPHVPDAWIDTSKTDPLDGQVGIVGYEIPFNRHFYQYQPPRDLAAIDADLDAVAVRSCNCWRRCIREYYGTDASTGEIPAVSSV